jgi:hypothetical protein
MSNFGFNLKGGRRIAVLKSQNKKNNQYIYLYNPKYICSSDCKNMKGCKCMGGCCDTIKYHENVSPEIYQKLDSPPNSKFMVAPTNIKDSVSNLFITGAQGSGKSVFCKDYLKVFKDITKSAPVFLVSEGEKDEVLDPYITKRISPNKIVEENLLFSDFQDIAEEYDGLIIIFDDIDALPSDKSNGFLKKKVYELMNSIINNSRKYKIHVLFTSHNALEGKYTGTMIRSCSNWVFFTNTINKNIEKCAITYFDFTLPQFKRLKELAEKENSHWISVATTIPKVIITEHSIFKLEDL